MDTCKQFLEEYDVKQCRLLYCNSTNNFTIQVTLLRRQEYYTFSTYLPSVLLLAIGYGTLHLPADFFNERGTMSLTTLLVFISLYTQMSASLPKTSYMKHIDMWYVFSLSYLSLIITIHLATCSTALSTRVKKVAPSPPCSRPLGMAVVSDTLSGSSDCPNTSSTWDVLILKISRVAFAVTAVMFAFYYFINV
ncbi:hypothetical protein O3P69_016509 [Scylla paramamosain]|uniref:Neurotransmitter-gated ion-channel transmembrane domain-containing protein n=1 Tax=Scylla paramamosain TaxID=85552 RepID=A0AAW0TEP7_SCYPA